MTSGQPGGTQEVVESKEVYEALHIAGIVKIFGRLSRDEIANPFFLVRRKIDVLVHVLNNFYFSFEGFLLPRGELLLIDHLKHDFVGIDRGSGTSLDNAGCAIQ